MKIEKLKNELNIAIMCMDFKRAIKIKEQIKKEQNKKEVKK